jgi:hypothetical protein
LIVIDTMSRLLTGMDENSSKDATLITNFMEAAGALFRSLRSRHPPHRQGPEQGRSRLVGFFANIDVVISTKKRQDGTELRVRKQKDADVSDEIKLFPGEGNWSLNRA